MAADPPGGTPGAVLCLTRRFAAPRAAVFRAFTDPEALRHWWVPTAGHSVPQVEVDCRPGGAYRITMQRPDGTRVFLTGVYREVRAPERLVYTWRWDNPTSDGSETLVTIDFRALDDGATEVAIRHEGFATERLRDLHDEGWSGCLGHLPAVLA